MASLSGATPSASKVSGRNATKATPTQSSQNHKEVSAHQNHKDVGTSHSVQHKQNSSTGIVKPVAVHTVSRHSKSPANHTKVSGRTTEHSKTTGKQSATQHEGHHTAAKHTHHKVHHKTAKHVSASHHKKKQAHRLSPKQVGK